MIARLATIAAICLFATSASALTVKECRDKYKAAQATGNQLKWNDFRKAECAADATAPKQTETTKAAEPKANAAAKPAETSKTATAPSASGNAVVPTVVSSKYSKESAGKARMHTCLDQYNENKANGGNGGMKWIEKGGGYYSECNKRIKG